MGQGLAHDQTNLGPGKIPVSTSHVLGLQSFTMSGYSDFSINIGQVSPSNLMGKKEFYFILFLSTNETGMGGSSVQKTKVKSLTHSHLIKCN